MSETPSPMDHTAEALEALEVLHTFAVRGKADFATAAVHNREMDDHMRKVATFIQSRTEGEAVAFVWVVWALKPGVAHLAAICTTEEKAERYVTDLPAGGGLSYQGCKMWKERVLMDHAFGWHDSVAALVTRGGAA